MVNTVLAGDAAVVEALRRGDEQAFAEVVERFQPMLRRVARGYVRTDEAVGDVIQETWIGVLRGIDRFEGRSSLRTWVVSILVNVARSLAVKEARTVPFASLGPADDGAAGFGADRFQGPDGELPGHWTTPPTPWTEDPEASAIAGETRALVAAAVATLPENQRAVITLRDVEGLSGPEVAAALGVSEGNQRVLLHRARAKVRVALDAHLSLSEWRASVTEDVPADGDLPCVQVVLLITEYLDDALSPADRARLDEHLAECDGCITVLEQFRTTVALTGRLSRDDLEQVPARSPGCVARGVPRLGRGTPAGLTGATLSAGRTSGR